MARGVDRAALSPDYRCKLFAALDVVSSTPVRVPNWRVIRALAGIGIALATSSILLIVEPSLATGAAEAICRTGVAIVALAIMAFRCLEWLKIERPPEQR
jgi:hypothetical protein